MLNIEKNKEGGKAVVKLSGRLDTTTSPVLENELRDFLQGATELVFDLEELEYISSAGLRVLLSVQKQMDSQGSMKLINVREEVNEIFEVTGFSDIMTIE